MTDAIDFSVKPDLLAALRTPWQDAMRERAARKDAALICRIERSHWRDTAWALREESLTSIERFDRNWCARNAARRFLAGLGYEV